MKEKIVIFDKSLLVVVAVLAIVLAFPVASHGSGGNPHVIVKSDMEYVRGSGDETLQAQRMCDLVSHREMLFLYDEDDSNIAWQYDGKRC